MTLMPEVPRLWLHAYVRVCSTELQLQLCTKFFNNSKYGFYRQVMALITVLIPFNKITQSGSWQPKLWINKMTSIWILTGKAIDCLHSLYTGELLCGHKKKAYPIGLLFMQRRVISVRKSPGGLLGLIFAGYVPLASQSTYPITAYFVANSPRQLQTPSLSLLGKYVIFAIPTFTFTFYFLELTHFLDWIRPLYFPSAVQTFWYIC